MLDQGIHDLETLLDRYETDGPDFLDGAPKRLLSDLYYLGDFKDAAVYGFFASSRFFLVDAPGGPGLNKFAEGAVSSVTSAVSRPFHPRSCSLAAVRKRRPGSLSWSRNAILL